MNRSKMGQWLLIPVLLFLWGSFAAGSKLALRQLDIFQLNFYMYVCGLLMSLFYLFLIRLLPLAQPVLLIAGEWKAMGLCGGLIFGYFFFYNLALSKLPAVTASVVNYTFPLFILLFDSVMKKKKITSHYKISAFLGMAGVILVLSSGKTEGFETITITGVLFGLAGAMCWGLFSVISSRVKSSMAAANLLYIMVGLFLSFLTLVTCSKPVIPGREIWLLVFWIGGCSFVLSNLLWISVMKLFGAGEAAAISFLTPFVNLVFIALILGEKVGSLAAMGLVLILCGVAVSKK